MREFRRGGTGGFGILLERVAKHAVGRAGLDALLLQTQCVVARQAIYEHDVALCERRYAYSAMAAAIVVLLE